METLKDKRYDSIISALQKIVSKTEHRPMMLRSDRGSEFTNIWERKKVSEKGKYSTTLHTKK